MSLRRPLAALLICTPLSAFAQGDNPGNQLSAFQLQDNSVLIVSPDGQVVAHAGADPAVVSHALRNAKPLSPGTIVIMRDGKLFMAKDHRMKSGDMLSDALQKPPK